MRAIALNCTLKPSPAESNTEALAQVVLDALAAEGVETEMIRLADHNVLPGVSSDEGPQDAWPAIRERIVAAEILVVATPTWLGQMSSVAKRALERMDAFLAEFRDDGRPIADDRVAGVVVTGNEDGAHAIIASLAQACVDLGYTVPGQAWTYWNKGPGPGEEEYLTTDEREWSIRTGTNAAANLLATARALQAHPLPKPDQ